MNAFAEEQASLFVCPGSQLYLFYSVSGKHGLQITFQMVCVTISAFSIIAGRGNLQHAKARREGTPRLRYCV